MGYPWDWWIDARRAYQVQVTGASQAQSVLLVQAGEALYLPGYGMFALSTTVAGNIFYLPWIPIQQQNLLIPVPRGVRPTLIPLTTNFPGYQLSVVEVNFPGGPGNNPN